MPGRILLHVGSPKTGTTFLQHVLWSNRERLLEQGVLLPLGSFHDHYLASIDVREETAQTHVPSRALGIWHRLAEEAQAWSGDVVVSHELFAGASAEQAEQAVKSLRASEVHVIVTARDLERQIPAEWQEHVKHRSTTTFAAFVDILRAKGPGSDWFWTVQDTADVCRRWGAAVPAGHTHLVTVPRDAPPSLLWERFAGLLGLSPNVVDLGAPRANESLHAEQVELLRRVNDRLGDRLPMPGPYPRTVKEVFAQTVLAPRPGTPIVLEGDDRRYAVERAGVIVDELRALDVDVVGDLADLVPPAQPPVAGPGTEHPESTSDAVLLDESLEALGGLLDELAKRQDAVAELTGERVRLDSELGRSRGELAGLEARHQELQERHDRLVHDMRYRPLRHLAIGASERRPGLMKVRVAYWNVVNAGRRLVRHLRP